VELLKETGVGRDINRPYFTMNQIADEMQRPVVRHLMNMARFRNTHPAFGGEFHLGAGTDHELHLGWTSDSASIRACINLETRTFTIIDTRGNDRRTITGWVDF
jgi:sucrose phosphorylase